MLYLVDSYRNTLRRAVLYGTAGGYAPMFFSACAECRRRVHVNYVYMERYVKCVDAITLRETRTIPHPMRSSTPYRCVGPSTAPT